MLIKQRNRLVLLFLMILQVTLPSCNPESQDRIIGLKIYSHDGPMEPLFNQWKHLGINTLFTSEELIANEPFRQGAKNHGMNTFVIFPVFFNAEELDRSPHLYASTSKGEDAIEEWVEFVCPSRETYREQVVNKAKWVARNYQPDGISIDFIRHFVFWEKVYPDREPASLPKTCFDSVCLDHFQRETGIELPATLTTTTQKADWILAKHPEKWEDWRCGLITSMVKEIAVAVKEIDPRILINIHLVPWTEQDFEGAIRSVAGQDIPALSEFTDYLSPMTYAHMLKRQAPWIHSIVKDLNRQWEGKVIPSIQVDQAYLESELEAEEFEQTLIEALKPPSNGVVFWSWERVADDLEKKEIIHTYCAL